MTVLEAQSLSVHSDGVQRLDNVDLQLSKGELVGLIGPNGAGKSTLLKSLASLQTGWQGSVTLHGRDTTRIDARERSRRLGYLEQSGAIHWPITVERLVLLGRTPHLSAWSAPSGQDRVGVETALRQTDTWHLRHRVATNLSGGERCRALLARVLAGEPEILLADEPIAALDPAHQLLVMDVFRQFVEAGGAAVVALHDLTLAARYCDRLLMLNGGGMVACGPPADVLNQARLADVYGVIASLGRDAGNHLTVHPYALTSKKAV